MHIHILRPTESTDEAHLERVNQFLYKHLEQYGDPKEDIRKAMNYALSTETGKGGLILYTTDEEKQQLIGAVVINDTGMRDYIPENILVYIAVDKTYRGQGIGKQLMQEAMRQVNGSIALHVEPDNPAKKLYEALGFTNKYLEMRWQNPKNT